MRAADAPSEPRPLAAVASNGRLPLPARTRIVRELGDDLGGLTEQLVAEGFSPEEAGRRAARVLVPVGPALEELEELTLPPYRRLVASFDARRVRLAERTGLGIATVLLLALESTTLLRAGALSDPSPYLWPVLGAGTLALVVVLAKAFQLWVKGAHDDLRWGLNGIPVLAAITLGIGFAGAVLGLVELAATVEVQPEQAVGLTTAWLVRDAALLSTAIILAVTGALGWLALNSWITWVEQAHAEALDLVSLSTEESS